MRWFTGGCLPLVVIWRTAGGKAHLEHPAPPFCTFISLVKVLTHMRPSPNNPDNRCSPLITNFVNKLKQESS